MLKIVSFALRWKFRHLHYITLSYKKFYYATFRCNRSGVVLNTPGIYGESSSLSYGLDSISSTPMQSAAGPRNSVALPWSDRKQGSVSLRQTTVCFCLLLCYPAPGWDRRSMVCIVKQIHWYYRTSSTVVYTWVQRSVCRRFLFWQ